MLKWKENELTIKEYFRLRESVGWLNFQEEQTKRALERSLYSVTVYEDGKVCGMGRLAGDGLYYLIVDIVVAPEMQGRGIGTEIVKRLLAFVDQSTPEGGRASVQLIAEKGKEHFYQSLGFKKLPHEYCGPGMRKVIYKKL